MPVEALPGQRVTLQSLIDESRTGNGNLLDVRWSEFETSMASFLEAIDSYALRAKNAIGDRAVEHVSSVRDLNAQKDETERQIQMEQQNESEMLQTIEHERHTLSEQQSSLSRLQANLNRTKETGNNLDSEVAATRQEIRVLRVGKERTQKNLADNRELDLKTRAALEKALGLVIHGVGSQRLLFSFSLIDPSEPSRGFSFVLDISKDDYVVPQCEPVIASMPDLVGQLNHDRNIYTFVKNVRKAFVRLVSLPVNGSMS